MRVTHKNSMVPVYAALGAGSVFALIGLLLMAVALVPMNKELEYHTGQCTIISKQVQQHINSTSSGPSTTYSPYFEYMVHTSDGHSYRTSGYDGGVAYSKNKYNEQPIVDQYQVGKSYTCWYDPTYPTAVLVRHFDSVPFFIGSIFLLFGLFFVAAAIKALFGFIRSK